MKSRTGLVITVIGLVAGGSCLAICLVVAGIALFGSAYYENLLARSSLQVGETAPDFELATLSGETLRLSDFRGQPVLLSFGASWCPDCRQAAPLLQSLHKRGSGVAVVMVDVQEDRAAVQDYADEFGFTFPVGLDHDGRVTQMYRVIAIPTELLIDEQGVIRARIIEQVTEETLATLLEEAGLEP